MNDGVPSLWRMGLPGFSWEGEALHGVSWDGVATIFPQNIAWGATFDPDLAHAIGDVIALEARAKYVIQRDARGGSAEFSSLSFMTPNNNLFPDPLWGRGQECYGEEPTLTSAITFAHIRGLQFGDDPNYTRIIATTKHFLGVSAFIFSCVLVLNKHFITPLNAPFPPLLFLLHSITWNPGQGMGSIAFHTPSITRKLISSSTTSYPSRQLFAPMLPQ